MTEQGRTESARERSPQDLERERLFVEFAKFGFYGVLSFAGISAVLIFALACLSAWTPFRIEMPLVWMTAIIAAAAVLFGYLSLWVAPRIAVEVSRWGKVGVDPEVRNIRT
jgi:hypothetical protein